jgi:hypothetical protein
MAKNAAPVAAHAPMDVEAARMAAEVAALAERKVKQDAAREAAELAAAELEATYRYKANTWKGMLERDMVPADNVKTVWTITDLTADKDGKMQKTTVLPSGYKAKNATVVTRPVETLPTTAEDVAAAADTVKRAEVDAVGGVKPQAGDGKVSTASHSHLLKYLILEAGFKPGDYLKD